MNMMISAQHKSQVLLYQKGHVYYKRGRAEPSTMHSLFIFYIVYVNICRLFQRRSPETKGFCAQMGMKTFAGNFVQFTKIWLYQDLNRLLLAFLCFFYFIYLLFAAKRCINSRFIFHLCHNLYNCFHLQITNSNKFF